MNELESDKFHFNFPAWFLVAESFTEIPPQVGHRILTTIEPRSFCGAEIDGKGCVLVFTDEDLAERAAAGIEGVVPLPIFRSEHAIIILRAFLITQLYDYIAIDAGVPGTWSNRQWTIAEFIDGFTDQQ